MKVFKCDRCGKYMDEFNPQILMQHTRVYPFYHMDGSIAELCDDCQNVAIDFLKDFIKWEPGKDLNVEA